jgi:hypothetical protein
MGVISCGTTMLDQGVFQNIGAVTWDTTAKTSGFTAVSGNGYFVNTTSAAITVTLPSSPSAGDIVGIKDYANTADTNNITIGRNGSNIEGIAEDFKISLEGGSALLVYVDGTQGWKLTSASQASDISQNLAFVTATGGNTTVTCGDFKTHIFTGPGTFCVSCAGNPGGSDTVEYLVVAGGGGAGGGGVCGPSKYQGGGGGGAGGWRSFTAISPSSPSNGPAALPVTVQGYPVTVGGGGAGDPAMGTGGSRGTNSVFSSITSTGGGGGGSRDTPQTPSPSPGGSGGGGAGQPDPFPRMSGGTGNTPPVSPVQGFNGGCGASRAAAPNSCSGAGGGGGGSAAGVSAPNCGIPGGTGGAGQYIPSPFIGPTAPSYGETGPAGRVFAGGGGGGAGGGPPVGPAAGGLGGGGNGGSAPIDGTAGTANTGGGGGGSYASQPRPSGGSGIVMIRYKFQ